MSRKDTPTCEMGHWRPMHEGCPVCGPNGPCPDADYERLIQAEKFSWVSRLLCFFGWHPRSEPARYLGMTMRRRPWLYKSFLHEFDCPCCLRTYRRWLG